MNSLRSFALALLAVGMFLAQLPAASADDALGSNLLKNANFEEGTDSWELSAFGGTGTMAMDPDQARNGKPTLRITSNDGTMTYVRQTVTVKPNTRYRLTGYLKTKDVRDLQGRKNGAILLVGLTSYATAGIQGTKGWTKISLELNSQDKTEIRVGASLGYYNSHVSGTVWVCEMKLTELGPTATR